MNPNVRLCIEMAPNFTNSAHLLKCDKNHSFEVTPLQCDAQFPRGAHCSVEILQVASPINLSIRILKYKDVNGIWCDWFSNESFNKFCLNFNAFYSESFETIRDISECNKNDLYVMRIRNDFYRCKILDTK